MALALNETATLIPLTDVATSIVTLSTLGFVIFFALPPIVALAWTYTKRTTGKDRLVDARVRLTFALARSSFIAAFLILAVSYLVTGVLVSFYWLLHIGEFVIIANYIEIANMIASIVLIVSLGFATQFASRSEIDKELKAASSPEEEIRKTLEELIRKFGDEEFIKKVSEYLPEPMLKNNNKNNNEKTIKPRKRVNKTKQNEA